MLSFWVRNGAIDGNTATTEAVEAATLAGIKEIQIESAAQVANIQTEAQKILDTFEIATVDETKIYLGLA